MNNSVQREDRGRNTMMLMNEALFHAIEVKGVLWPPRFRMMRCLRHRGNHRDT